MRRLHLVGGCAIEVGLRFLPYQRPYLATNPTAFEVSVHEVNASEEARNAGFLRRFAERSPG